jgi:hypothetical protein
MKNEEWIHLAHVKGVVAMCSEHGEEPSGSIRELLQ